MKHIREKMDKVLDWPRRVCDSTLDGEIRWQREGEEPRLFARVKDNNDELPEVELVLEVNALNMRMVEEPERSVTIEGDFEVVFEVAEKVRRLVEQIHSETYASMYEEIRRQVLAEERGC